MYFSVLLNVLVLVNELNHGHDFTARWIARWNDYSRMLKHAENPFQRALNVTQQLYILVLYCAEMFLADFKMAAVFLAKL
jgi:hypothetical protein